MKTISHTFISVLGAVLLFLIAFATGTLQVHAACTADALTAVRYGQQGMAVTTLQQCLMEAGYAIPAGATGYYGAQTQQAVQDFYAQEFALQNWDGLTVGSEGRAKLTGKKDFISTSNTPVVQASTATVRGCGDASLGTATYGQASGAVTQLQQCLMEAGYSIPAGVTGYYGAQTQRAVQAFYAEVLRISDWHGKSVGPVGRSALMAQTQEEYHPVSIGGYKNVKSAEELRTYIQEERTYRTTGLGARTVDFAETTADTVPTVADASSNTGSQEKATRVSETNVQVRGIDEPDIVKTDGESLFVSMQSYWYGIANPRIIDDSVVVSDMMMPERVQANTVVVDAFPAEDLAVASDAIEEVGEMLLVEDLDILVIFARPNIVAYDISDPAEPVKKWELTLADDTSVLTARLLDNQIYLVTQTHLDPTRPCPLVPIMRGKKAVTVPCQGILIPERIEPVSHTYTVLSVDPAQGNVEKQVAVAGESGGTTVAMFMDNIYIATRVYSAQHEVLLDLMIEVMSPYMSADVVAKARAIQMYDISDIGKLDEVEKVFEVALRERGADERMRIENEAANVFQDELQKRVREMYRTRIARVALDTLTVEAASDVPGYLLNQFALDEYDEHVRVAVTVDDGWGNAESVNDVYVLDMDLQVVGSIQDFGLTERVYAVRFMGETGYVVTFRQIDPFYVLDLRKPNSPKVTGELKIPGYSAYLEPLGDDLVLGVGRDGGNVKLSVFDVSDPTKPVEKDTYQLQEGWTDVENNHRAFLRDAKHEIFFIPGSQGGYVFSYAEGELALVHTIAGYAVKRAVYIDDNLYIVSNDAVRVFYEMTWEEVASVEI